MTPESNKTPPDASEALKRYQEAKKDPRTPYWVLSRLWDAVVDEAEQEMEEKNSGT